jgi:fumarate reductase flavoprotein subunit
MKKILLFIMIFFLTSTMLLAGDKKAKEAVAEDFIKTDVVVIGGGAAGLMAALKSAETGVNVVLMEKMAFLGGNTIISAGIIQAAGTSVQREYGVEGDSPEKFIEDLKHPGRDYTGQEFVFSTIMHEGSRDMVEKLRDRGLEFVNFQEANKRMHIMYPELYRGGSTLIGLLKDLSVNAKVEIMLNTEAKELIEENGAIVGVKANHHGEMITVKSKAVILATGGFSSNPEMIRQYLPQLSDLKSRASKGITGDGIRMAQKHGAETVAMSAGQHMFYVNPDKEIDVPLLLAFTPAIIVNTEGKRFINEAIDYAAAARAAVSQPGKKGFIVFDEMVRRSHEPMEKYFEVGIVVEAGSIKELAEKMEMPQLVDTINRYNEMAKAGVDKEFNREYNFMPLVEPKYYAITVQPMIYNSYGGLKIDTKCRVLKADGEHIKGLYAAGEVSGSVEVQEGLNYTSGIAQALVYGEIAAQTARNDMK